MQGWHRKSKRITRRCRTSMPSQAGGGKPERSRHRRMGRGPGFVAVGSSLPARTQHAGRLAERLHAGLAQIPNICACTVRLARLPIASVTIDDLAPSDAAAILDAEFGIETRAGHALRGTDPLDTSEPNVKVHFASAPDTLRPSPKLTR